VRKLSTVKGRPHYCAPQPHQIEVRRRQHGEHDTGASEAPRHCLKTFDWKTGGLGYMADRDASAIFVLVGAAADMVEGHIVRSRPKIKVHIDVDVELPRHLEDAINLSKAIARPPTVASPPKRSNTTPRPASSCYPGRN
jgi:hypothetical protein